MALRIYGTPTLCISYVTFRRSKRSTFRCSKRSTFRCSKRTPDQMSAGDMIRLCTWYANECCNIVISWKHDETSKSSTIRIFMTRVWHERPLFDACEVKTSSSSRTFRPRIKLLTRMTRHLGSQTQWKMHFTKSVPTCFEPQWPYKSPEIDSFINYK